MRNIFSSAHSLLLIVIIGVLFSSCKNEKSKQIDPDFVQYISGFTYGTISPQSYIQVIGTRDANSRIECRGER